MSINSSFNPKAYLTLIGKIHVTKRVNFWHSKYTLLNFLKRWN